MKSILFVAAALAVPAAFAQSSTVASETTVMGAAPAAVVMSPSNSPVSDFPFMRHQNSVVAAEVVSVPQVASASSSTAVMGASAGPVVRYWWNVPSDIGQREDFRRWRSLL